jgi:heme-degrading monooxygenase HmoA
MIARVWHGRVPAARADEYMGYMRETGLRDFHSTPGFRGVQVLRRADDDIVHFVLVSLWESLDAIRLFSGDPIDRARYYPEDAAYLLELEPNVQHYEVLGGPAGGTGC